MFKWDGHQCKKCLWYKDCQKNCEIGIDECDDCSLSDGFDCVYHDHVIENGRFEYVEEWFDYIEGDGRGDWNDNIESQNILDKVCTWRIHSGNKEM